MTDEGLETTTILDKTFQLSDTYIVHVMGLPKGFEIFQPRHGGYMAVYETEHIQLRVSHLGSEEDVWCLLISTMASSNIPALQKAAVVSL